MLNVQLKQGYRALMVPFQISLCIFSHTVVVDHLVGEKSLSYCQSYIKLVLFLGFPYQRLRLHMPHIPSLGYSHCEVIHLRPFVFYPDKPIQVQVTVNHVDTRDMNYVHDAAVSWIEDVRVEQFTACVMEAGFN